MGKRRASARSNGGKSALSASYLSNTTDYSAYRDSLMADNINTGNLGMSADDNENTTNNNTNNNKAVRKSVTISNEVSNIVSPYPNPQPGDNSNNELLHQYEIHQDV